MTKSRLFGVLTGLIGVIIMIGGDVLQTIGVNALAQLAILGAAISYAFAGVYGRAFKKMALHPVTTATGQITVSTHILAPVALYIDQPWALAMPGRETIAALFGLAALSTALAYILYFLLLQALQTSCS